MRVSVNLSYITTCSLPSHYIAVRPPLCVLICAVCVSVVVYFGSRREGENWNWAWVVSTGLARHIGYMELLLKLMFVNPPELPEQTTRALPVRYSTLLVTDIRSLYCDCDVSVHTYNLHPAPYAYCVHTHT